jgi:hypothetical protein
MSAALLSDPKSRSEQARAVLERQGFEPCEGGYRRGALLFQRSGSWISLTHPWPDGRDPLGGLGAPGLWKALARDGEMCRAFRLPEWILREEAGDPDEDGEPAGGDATPLLESCLHWAAATLGGDPPAGWIAPDHDLLASWTGGNLLTIQQGSVVRQIEVIVAPGRFALRVPLVTSIPEDFHPARLRWLRRILGDVQDCWNLIRAGITPEGSAGVEIDLSGVPGAVSRPLVLAGVESLRGVVAGILETTEFIIAPGTVTQLLDSPPCERRPANKQ